MSTTSSSSSSASSSSLTTEQPKATELPVKPIKLIYGVSELLEHYMLSNKCITAISKDIQDEICEREGISFTSSEPLSDRASPQTATPEIPILPGQSPKQIVGEKQRKEILFVSWLQAAAIGCAHECMNKKRFENPDDFKELYKTYNNWLINTVKYRDTHKQQIDELERRGEYEDEISDNDNNISDKDDDNDNDDNVDDTSTDDEDNDDNDNNDDDDEIKTEKTESTIPDKNMEAVTTETVDVQEHEEDHVKWRSETLEYTEEQRLVDQHRQEISDQKLQHKEDLRFIRKNLIPPRHEPIFQELVTHLHILYNDQKRKQHSVKEQKKMTTKNDKTDNNNQDDPDDKNDENNSSGEDNDDINCSLVNKEIKLDSIPIRIAHTVAGSYLSNRFTGDEVNDYQVQYLKAQLEKSGVQKMKSYIEHSLDYELVLQLFHDNDGKELVAEAIKSKNDDPLCCIIFESLKDLFECVQHTKLLTLGSDSKTRQPDDVSKRGNTTTIPDEEDKESRKNYVLPKLCTANKTTLDKNWLNNTLVNNYGNSDNVLFISVQFVESVPNSKKNEEKFRKAKKDAEKKARSTQTITPLMSTEATSTSSVTTIDESTYDDIIVICSLTCVTREYPHTILPYYN
jgi:hypothetical protein